MKRFGAGRAILIVSSLITGATATTASARPRHHHHDHPRYTSRGERHVIQCVAFARADTGIELAGNAVNWWNNAAGRYARGSAPEVGSVLNFRANTRMRLGHVAVVSNVVNSRVVRIDQSHWESRGVSRDVSVVDVSPDNDWSAVRVALGHGDTYGSIYPTYGFIYPRPDDSSTSAASDATWHAAAPVREARRHSIVLEVAEAPAKDRAIDLSTPAIGIDAPDRDLR